jgi:hypothetical protein
MVGVRSDASQGEAKLHHALVSQNLLRAANDGYDVSPLLECGADPMSSGEPHLCPTLQTRPVCSLACPRVYAWTSQCGWPHAELAVVITLIQTPAAHLSLQVVGRAHVRNKSK